MYTTSIAVVCCAARTTSLRLSNSTDASSWNDSARGAKKRGPPPAVPRCSRPKRRAGLAPGQASSNGSCRPMPYESSARVWPPDVWKAAGCRSPCLERTLCFLQSAPPAWCGRTLACRQGERERRPLRARTAQLRPAPVKLGHGADDGEAEAGSALAVPGGGESLEQLLADGRIDARSLVRD